MPSSCCVGRSTLAAPCEPGRRRAPHPQVAARRATGPRRDDRPDSLPSRRRLPPWMRTSRSSPLRSRACLTADGLAHAVTPEDECEARGGEPVPGAASVDRTPLCRPWVLVDLGAEADSIMADPLICGGPGEPPRPAPTLRVPHDSGLPAAASAHPGGSQRPPGPVDGGVLDQRQRRGDVTVRGRLKERGCIRRILPRPSTGVV
jgi:hypothetical protein